MIIAERPIIIGDKVVDLSLEIPLAEDVIELLEKAIVAGIDPHELNNLRNAEPLTNRFIELLQEAMLYK